MKSILDLLTEDHNEIESLSKTLEDSYEFLSSDEKEELFEELCYKISAHSMAEEEVIYSRVSFLDGYKLDALLMHQEHHVFHILLQELRELSFESEDWLPKFSILKGLLEHHIREEKDTFFLRLKDHYAPAQLVKIGRFYEARKARLIPLLAKAS